MSADSPELALKGGVPDVDPDAETAGELGPTAADSKDTEHQAALERVRARMLGAKGGAQKIGRYAVLNVLGEGGMGTVYAVYDDQLDRRVALKVLKGVKSEDARGRMLREAQAMAKLSHPNVVPVFEVGEHDGELFVAMEYVVGTTLKEWCDDQDRNWRDVLEKYVQAGRGLAAAHAEGLVHRDFKPHNAIVGEDDRVRVLDFGLAARGGEVDASADKPSSTFRPKKDALETPLTETGTVMGTPAYMSPEQFVSGTIDHRSDQFSFCIALWEALYGQRPFVRGETEELLNRIARGEFTKPLNTGVPAALRPLLVRGLQHAAGDRWPDLSTLLFELERQNVDPAKARRTRRIAVGVTLAGVLGVGGVLEAHAWLLARETQECELGAAAEAEGFWNDNTRNRVRGGLLGSGVSYAATTAEKVLPWLDRYAEDWRSARAETCVVANVEHSWTRDQVERSLWCLEERSVGLRVLIRDLEHADNMTMTTAVAAAAGLMSIGDCRNPSLLERRPPPPSQSQRASVTAAQEALLRAHSLLATRKFASGLEIARGAAQQAQALEQPSLRAAAMVTVGTLLERTGEIEEARTVLEDAYFESTKLHNDQAAATAGWALSYIVGGQLGRPDQGVVWVRHAQAALDELELEPDHPLVAYGLERLGTAHTTAGDYDQAKLSLEEALYIREKTLSPDHPDVARALEELANVHGLMGDHARAKAMKERALAVQKAALGPDHPEVARGLSGLASDYALTGDFVYAKTLFAEALALQEAAHGPEHAALTHTLNGLANVNAQTGDFPRAKALYERALAIGEKQLRPDHPDLAFPISGLANLAGEEGDDARALVLWERAVDIWRRSLGPDHPDVAYGINSLAMAHSNIGNHAKAMTMYREALSIRERAMGPDHPEVAYTLVNFAIALANLSELAEAKSVLERALAIYDADGRRLPGEPEARFAYAELLVEIGGDRRQAIAEARKAAEGLRQAGEMQPEALAGVEAWLREHDDGPG